MGAWNRNNVIIKSGEGLLRTGMLCSLLFCSFRMGFGSVTWIGSDFDLGSGWRTSTVPKIDIEGNDILGTDGWFVAGNYGSEQIPTYLSFFTTIGNVYGGNGGYYAIDNPNTTPGASPSTIVTGTLNPSASSGNTLVDATFTFSSSVPAVVQVGLMIDNLDIAAFNPSALQIVQSGGPGASAVVNTTGSEYNDRVPDWVFFDIDAQPGETYQVLVTGGTNGCACLGAISFDSASTPEPSSLWLGGLGVGLLGAATLLRR
jgi:hypothetical protein